jgi:hypothetical protein
MKFQVFLISSIVPVASLVVYSPLKKMSVTKAIARVFGKMLVDSICIFWKLCKRRRRLANEFLDKLVLGCFCLLGLGLFAGCGCVTLLFGCVAARDG